MLRLVEPRPWWRLVPDTNHELVTAGTGSPGSAGYVTAARADDGSFALIYFPESRELTVDVSKLKQPAHASWFDPTTGGSRPIQPDPLPGRGSRSFSPPGRNAAGEPDARARTYPPCPVLKE